MGACYSATAQTHSLPTPSTMHMLAELRARMRSIDAAKAKTESNRTLAHVTDSTLIPWSKVSLAKKRNLWAVNVLRACLFGDGSKEIAFINWICLLLNRGKKSPCAHDNTLHKTQLRPMWGLPTVIPYVWSSDKSNHDLVHAYDSEPKSFRPVTKIAHARWRAQIQPHQCSQDGNACR